MTADINDDELSKLFKSSILETLTQELSVSSLLSAAYFLSLTNCKAADGEKINGIWVRISHKIGSLLPGSLLVVSVQQAGTLDLLIRKMEDEYISTTSSENLNPTNAAATLIENEKLTIQFMMSELWIGTVYEFMRLLADRSRKLAPDGEEFAAIKRDLSLLRIPIEKHEVASDQKLKTSLKLVRNPFHNDENDNDLKYLEYSKDDPKRSISLLRRINLETGSIEWNVYEVESQTARWLSRREISDRILAFWSSVASPTSP